MDINKLKVPKATKEGSGTIKINQALNELDYYLELLEGKFRNELPTTLITREELARQVGQQDVIRYLYALIEKENIRKD